MTTPESIERLISEAQAYLRVCAPHVLEREGHQHLAKIVNALESLRPKPEAGEETPTIHDQIIRCVEQAGHPDWSLREMVERLKQIAKDARSLERRLREALLVNATLKIRHEAAHAEVMRLADKLRQVDQTFNTPMHLNTEATERQQENINKGK